LLRGSTVNAPVEAEFAEPVLAEPTRVPSGEVTDRSNESDGWAWPTTAFVSVILLVTIANATPCRPAPTNAAEIWVGWLACSTIAPSLVPPD
jgi:hypothetical protein